MLPVVHEILRARVNNAFRRTRRQCRENFHFDAISDRRFKELFRINKAFYRELCRLLTPHLHQPKHRDKVIIDHKILVSLRFYATGSYQRCVGGDFNLAVSQTSVHRFPENEAKILLAILYLPIGLIILLLLRCALAIFLVIFGQVLPDSPVIQTFLNNLACLCFGITVSVDNIKKNENVDVYISNSLSLFDHVAVSKAIGFVLPLNKTPLQSLPSLGINDFGAVTNPENFKKNLDTITKEKKIPVVYCPEETPTNGRALLKFNAKYFQFFERVQPLCVTLKRPFLDISVSTIGSTYINDLLYFMYSPFTNYSIKFLPSLEKKSLSEDEYAEIVRQNIASELKVEASTFSSSDVAEWSKRRLAEEKRRNQERANSQLGAARLPNPELARMATQVKEVLPHVPVVTIYNDLGVNSVLSLEILNTWDNITFQSDNNSKPPSHILPAKAVTRSIDTTIINILEGRVRYVPESPSVSPVASTSNQPSTSYSASESIGSISHTTLFHLNTGAASFGKSASERTKSFQERKEQLIAASRRRYIEKHNLNLPV